MLRLEVWAALILTQGFMETGQSGLDSINRIATELTFDLTGLDGDFLRKSLQELFFQIAGTDDEITESDLASRLMIVLRRRGSAGLLRRFLSVHLFNVVWFQTGDSFRALAWTPNSFVHDMETVEVICRRIVDSTWRSRKLLGPLDRASASELVEQLALRLTRP